MLGAGLDGGQELSLRPLQVVDVQLQPDPAIERSDDSPDTPQVAEQQARGLDRVEQLRVDGDADARQPLRRPAELIHQAVPLGRLGEGRQPTAGQGIHLAGAQTLGDTERGSDPAPKLATTIRVAGEPTLACGEVSHRQVEEVQSQPSPAQRSLEIVQLEVVGVQQLDGPEPGRDGTVERHLQGQARKVEADVERAA